MSATHVVKVGGSLFSQPGAMASLARWLEDTRVGGEVRLLVPGGGPPVDGLRAIDRANPLPAAASHGGAIAMMDAHAGLLAAWLPGVRVIEAGESVGPGDYAVVVGGWLRDAEPNLAGERIAPGWQTTSDAIAARLAACLDARLTLLKSFGVGTYHDLAAAAGEGVVDTEAPRVAPKSRSARVVPLGPGRERAAGP